MTQATPSLDHESLAEVLFPAVVGAGRLVLEHRRQGVRMERKRDGSPVTAADRDAEVLLLAAIGTALPGVPVLSEEAESGAPSGAVDPAGLLVMVDPLDGTREYIAGGSDFTVNVGVAVDGVPSFGMILQPTTGRLFATLGERRAIEADVKANLEGAAGTWKRLAKRTIATREPDRSDITALASRSHDAPEAAQFLRRFSVRETWRLGSSLKFCLLAAGEADIYPRFGPTHVWDTCAGYAILVAAGGAVTTSEGVDLRYTRLEPPFLNPHFIAWGRRELGNFAGV